MSDDRLTRLEEENSRLVNAWVRHMKERLKVQQERDELKKRVEELEELIMLHKKTTHESPDMDRVWS